MWLASETYGETELRTVAIKLFALEASPDGLRWILQEARALCRVEHPNVVRFYSIAVDAAHRTMGLAMEYLAGTSLDRKLAAFGKLSALQAIDVGMAVSSALAAVHRTGVVHRDVKPANIIETDSGYKLIDFGIARGPRTEVAERPFEVEDVAVAEMADGRSVAMRTGPTDRRTVTGLVGTIGFIDPESLARAAPATGSSDLYSLGATLFQLITGNLPAASGALLRGDVLGGRSRAPSLGTVSPGLPARLIDLVDQLLSPTRDERPKSADWVAARLQEIRYELVGRQRALPPETVGPFRGLARFEVADQGIYFARLIEIAQALQVLRVQGVVALLGPSGSGKSSLARAGIVPALTAGELGPWPAKWDAIIVVPGTDPRAALLEALAPMLEEAGTEAPWGWMARGSQSELVAALGDRVQRTGRGVLLVIDQLEELATLSRVDSREWMAELLGAFRGQPLPGVRAVVTARRDLLAPLLDIAGLGRALLHNAILIEPMTPSGWGEVLERALEAYGYAWENEELGLRISAEIEQTASAMPLVQFALARLWEGRDSERRLLTWRAYHRMGGIAGALAQHAETTLDHLAGELADGAAVARRTLLALSTAQGTRAVRDAAAVARAAGSQSEQVLQAFEQARLVVRLPAGYTLAHEALLTGWARLSEWLSSARDARLIVDQLEHDAERWVADHDAVSLWRKRRLALVAEALELDDVVLSDGARAFFEAALKAERRRRFTLGAAAAALATMAIGASAIYVRAVDIERTRTQAALEGERASRLVAETRTREVQAAQQRIDELLRGLGDSSAKAEVIDLQAKIRDAPARSRPEPLLRARALEPAVEPPSAPSASTAAPPSAPRIRVREAW